jgi:quercetin dioxygenase-like cupin family protein
MSDKRENNSIHDVVSPDFERTISYLENLMTVVCDFKNGPMKKPDPPHSHTHEQITYVAEGELLFFINEEKQLLKKGDMVTIPSGLPHYIQTLTSHVRLIDSFSPVRKDFIKNI